MTTLLRNTNSRQVTVQNVNAYGYVCRTATTGREMWEMAFSNQNMYVVMYGESPYPINYSTLKRYARFVNDLYLNGVPITEWSVIVQDYENNQGRPKLQTISCYERWVMRESRRNNRRYHANNWTRKSYLGQSLQSWANRPLSSPDVEAWKRSRGYLPKNRF